MSYKVKEPTLLSLLICLEKVSKSYIWRRVSDLPAEISVMSSKYYPSATRLKLPTGYFVYRFGSHGHEVTLALRHLTSTRDGNHRSQ